MRRESRVCYPAFVFCSCWRNAEFILASTFSCPDLNAGPEPRVVAPWRRDAISRVCCSCNATPAFAIPASGISCNATLASATLASLSQTCVYLCTLLLSNSFSPSSSYYYLSWRVRKFQGLQSCRLFRDLGECSRFPLDFLFHRLYVFHWLCECSRSRLHLGFPLVGSSCILLHIYTCHVCHVHATI